MPGLFSWKWRILPLLLLLFCSRLPAQEARLADHVVLISIDGLRPDFYLDDSWPAPMIQEMARRGVHAEGVRGVFPTVTYPSHTTLVTGALPARHGVFYNSPFEPGGQTGRWYWEESLIRCGTLWDAVAEAGLESASVTWPVTVGAPITRLVPEFWSLDDSEPPMQAMRETTRPSELWGEIEREATGRLSARNFSIGPLIRDETAGRAAAYLLETYRPALLAVHLLDTDHFQHELGRKGEQVRRAVAVVDHAVSMIHEAAMRAGILERTAFVVTGDHGFVDIHSRLAPNIWLVKAGLMEDRPDRGDWKAAFHTTGGSAFLHLKEPGDHATLERVHKLLWKLPPRYRRLFRIVEEEELRAIGVDPSVSLALSALPGIYLASDTHGPLLRPSTIGGTHGHFPDFAEIQTGFVGFGSGFKPGAVAPLIGMEDIAPLIARLLGLPFEAPDGVLYPGLLEAADGH